MPGHETKEGGEGEPEASFVNRFIHRCRAEGYKVTPQRIAVARAVAVATGHPTMDELHHQIREKNSPFSLANVYRSVSLMVELGLVHKHEFGDGKARIEVIAERHHDHLIDVTTGAIVEFAESGMVKINKNIAEKLGFELIDYKLEIYARPLQLGDKISPKAVEAIELNRPSSSKRDL